MSNPGNFYLSWKQLHEKYTNIPTYIIWDGETLNIKYINGQKVPCLILRDIKRTPGFCFWADELNEYLLSHHNVVLIENIANYNNAMTEEDEMLKPYIINEQKGIVTFKNWLCPSDYNSFDINLPKFTDNFTIEDYKNNLKNCYLFFKANYAHQSKSKQFIENIITFAMQKNANDKKIVKLCVPMHVCKRLIAIASNDIKSYTDSQFSSIKCIDKQSFSDAGAYCYKINEVFKINIILQELEIAANKIESLILGKEKEIAITENNYIKTHFYSILGNNNTPNNAFQYELSNKVNKTSTTTDIYQAYHDIYEHRHANSEYTIKLSVLAEKSKGEIKEFTFIDFYPEYPKDLNSLRAYHYAKIARDVTQRKYFFDHFNAIKNKLLFYGMNEHEAVTKILSDAGINDGLFTCEITNQLLPNALKATVTLIDGKTKLTANSIWLIHFGAFNGICRYQGIDGIYTVFNEIPLTTDKHWYASNIQEHGCYTMKHLSVRALPEENVKVFRKHNLFEPVPYMGFELEAEIRNTAPADITEQVLNAFGKEYVVLERDGSVPGGLEAKSVPATLKYHRYKAAKFFDNMKLKSHLNSFNASVSCGIHVHISRNAFTGLHLAKFMKFINMGDNSIFIDRLAQRKDNHFSRFADWKDVKGRKSVTQYANHIGGKLSYMPSDNRGHYCAVNTANRETIEVRIFKGNLAKLHFYKNIEFVHALWAFTKNCSLQDVGYKDFIHWLFKENNSDYAELMQWVIASGFNISNVNVPKDKKGNITDATKALKSEEAKKLQSVVKKKYGNEEKFKKIGKDKFLSTNDILASA